MRRGTRPDLYIRYPSNSPFSETGTEGGPEQERPIMDGNAETEAADVAHAGPPDEADAIA